MHREADAVGTAQSAPRPRHSVSHWPEPGVQPEQAGFFESDAFPETWRAPSVVSELQFEGLGIISHAQELQTASQELPVQLQCGLDLEKL